MVEWKEEFEKKLKTLKKLKLTENQEKVIKDKYLKDSPTFEHWLFGVANNVALAELLYLDAVDEKDVYEGVRCRVKELDVGSGKTAKMVLLHSEGESASDLFSNFNKYVENLNALAVNNAKARPFFEKTRDKFWARLSAFEFLPNSPCLMNAGRNLQQLSACFVLPVDDSVAEIYQSLTNMALIHKSGGGTGFSFSRLRPKNDVVNTTKGFSSGPISFMTLFDKSTEVINQGGTRRGANMGILSVYHPDIMAFINAKKEPGKLENFNISVALDENFMNAVKEDRDIELINPKNNKVSGKLNARKLFNDLVKSAWETADPGVIFLDRINDKLNPVPHLGNIESTNPCGEQPLLPYEACNLGSINVSLFVKNDGSDFDWVRLKECVRDSVLFLNNMIDLNNFPIPKIEEFVKGTRRIGLGIMGLAEALVRLELPYNDELAFAKAEELMKFINDEALKMSCELAEQRGVFPYFKNSIYDKAGQYFKGTDAKPGNAARTVIAPTGTIAIAAGLQGSGIEPFFAVVYTRYNAAAIDKLKSGQEPNEKDVFYEINPFFRQIAERHRYFGLKPEELWKKIEKNHKSLKGMPEIPEDIQNLFLTAHDLSPIDHVRMQCAFQKHLNASVSKTVNLKNSATIEDVEEVYLKAYELGAMGVTIYRDGSKSFQILNLDKKKKDEKKEKQHPAIERAAYYQVQTGQGPLHIHVNYDELGPTRIFVNISPLGTEISGLTTALGILISKYIEIGGDPVGLLKHLNSIKGDKPIGFGPKRVDSIPHGISKALRSHLISTGKLKSINGQEVLSEDQTKLIKDEFPEPPEGAYCPKCFSSNVEIISGCSEPTCLDCGYSKCG
ncbi:MAG: adenosylcobalamin-dependent ribonucleoside-diphosphate reductase [Candidatus Woesearchaeota archaeon]